MKQVVITYQCPSCGKIVFGSQWEPAKAIVDQNGLCRNKLPHNFQKIAEKEIDTNKHEK